MVKEKTTEWLKGCYADEELCISSNGDFIQIATRVINNRGQRVTTSVAFLKSEFAKVFSEIEKHIDCS